MTWWCNFLYIYCLWQCWHYNSRKSPRSLLKYITGYYHQHQNQYIFYTLWKWAIYKYISNRMAAQPTRGYGAIRFNFFFFFNGQLLTPTYLPFIFFFFSSVLWLFFLNHAPCTNRLLCCLLTAGWRDEKPVLGNCQLPLVRFLSSFCSSILRFFILFHESGKNRLQFYLLTAGCLVCRSCWDRNPQICICPFSSSSFYFLFVCFFFAHVSEAFTTRSWCCCLARCIFSLLEPIL